MKKFCSVCISIFLIQMLWAQNDPLKGKINGKVLNKESNLAIEQVNISLHKFLDSSLVKVTAGNEQGDFKFEGIAEGRYFIKVSHVNFQPYFSSSLQIDGNNFVFEMGNILLSNKSENLGSAIVQSYKPFIEKKADRLILNIENSIVSAGGTAAEILEYAPGVEVEQNGKISINGRNNVLVTIDGRQSPLSPSDLNTYLKSLPSNTIEKIEIITNPSAHYDASGSAGIINIRMKKDRKMGFNGNFTASYGQGIYEKLNTGISLNYRNKKFNLYGNYAFGFRKNFEDIFSYRNLLRNGKRFNTYDQRTYIVTPVTTHNFRSGVDFFISKATTIGLLIDGAFSGTRKSGNNETNILDSTALADGRFNTRSSSSEKWKNGAVNLNVIHKLDDKGKELTINLNTALYKSENNQNFISNYFNILNYLYKRDTLIGRFNGDLNLYSAKIDYANPIGKNDQIDIGFKTSFVRTDNDVQFFNKVNTINVFDSSKSNHFIYNENINAGYIVYSHKFSTWTAELGLRAEQTIAKGRQFMNGEYFRRNYLQLFPSLFITQKINDKHELSYSLSKRIDRPDYQQLNPFKLFYDPSTYDEGNPALLPQITYTLEASHTYKEKYITTFTYSYIKDYIAYVVLQNPQDLKTSVLAIKNIKYFSYFNFNIYAPVKISNAWSFSNSIGVSFSKYGGSLVDNAVNHNGFSFRNNMQHTIKLSKNWSSEVIFTYRSRGLHPLGYNRPRSNVTIGVQKNIMQNRGTLRLNIKDIFYTTRIFANTKFANVDETWKQFTDSRSVTLSFTLQFGKKTVTAARKRDTGLETEQNRIQVSK